MTFDHSLVWEVKYYPQSHSSYRQLDNIPKNIVYSGGKSNVRLTMCAGKVLYECGEYFIGEQPEKIFANAQRLVDGMK